MTDNKTGEIYEELERLLSQNETEKAELLLLSCQEQAKEENDFALYITIGNELTGFYRAMSMYEKAFAASEDVLLLMEELQLEDTEHFAAALLNAASAYHAAGLLEEARRNYVRSLKIYEEKLPPKDIRLSGLYSDMSRLLEQMGETEEAALLLEKAVEILSDSIKLRTDLAAVQTNLALILLKLDRTKEAHGLLQSSIEIFSENRENTDPRYAAALSGMGETCYRLGRLERSLSYYEESLDEVEKHFGRNISYALLCGNCAAICHELGLSDKQMQYSQTESLLKKQLGA